MDFSKLSKQELDEFLSIDYGIPIDTRLSKVEQATTLYQELEERGNIRYPTPIWDLWYASEYDGPTDVEYTREQIMNLTEEEVYRFDDIFQFDAYHHSLQHNRKQIYRILKLLRLIQSVGSSEFLNPGVLNTLCEILSVDDLNNLRIANNVAQINCLILINDKDGKIMKVNELTNQTYNWIKQIERNGSLGTFLELSRVGDLDGIKYLIHYGINPETDVIILRERRLNILKEGFDWAVEYNHPEIIEFFMNETDRVGSGISDDDINRGLSIASRNRHLNLVKFFINHGANFNYKENNNSLEPTAIHFAALGGGDQIIAYLLQLGDDVNRPMSNGSTPLFLAAENGHLSTCQLLVSKGAEVNVYNSSGETPLYEAVKNGHNQVVNFLLQNGADPNVNPPRGVPILVQAYNGWHYSKTLEHRSNHWEILVDLLDYGVDTEYSDRRNDTLLHMAMYHLNIDIITLLLEKGADPDTTDRVFGHTLLHIASFTGLNDIARLLLQHGADPTIYDNSGRTPIQMAKMAKTPETRRLLKNYMKYGIL